MPTCGESTFGRSMEYQQRLERTFYAEYSKRHPPKHRVSLVEREGQFMKTLRGERDTKGFSEGFLERRRFPIKPVEPVEDPEFEISSNIPPAPAPAASH